MNTPVALAIACSKATLVILFFMHVKYSPRLIGMVVVVSIAFPTILFLITLSDYWTRGAAWECPAHEDGRCGNPPVCGELTGMPAIVNQDIEEYLRRLYDDEDAVRARWRSWGRPEGSPSWARWSAAP